MRNVRIKISLFLLSTSFLFACGPQEKAIDIETAAFSKKKVHTQKVKSLDYQETILASGKISSEATTKLSFKKGGRIQQLLVTTGQNVKAGQLLATLEVEEAQIYAQQAELDSERAAIAIKNTQLLVEKAQRDFNNVEGLFQDSVATLEALENAKTQLVSLKNQLRSAYTTSALSQQKQAAVTINLSDARLVAPTAGTILKQWAEPTEIVGGGTPVYLLAPRQKGQVLKVHVSDKDVIHLQIGDEAQVHFDPYPTDIFKGFVSEIAPIADPVFSTFEVKIKLLPTNKKLFSGFIGQVAIQSQISQSLIGVPIAALVSANGNKGKVYLLQNNKAILTDINIHKIDNDQLLVTTGLLDGQEVLVTGIDYVHENEEVLVGK